MQKTVLKVFLVVFFLVLGFLVIRYLTQLFGRAEDWIEDQKEAFKPVTMFSETVIAGETLAGLFVIGLTVLKIISYVGTLLSVTGLILGQFGATRSLLTDSVTRLFSIVINGIESVIRLIPGLILAMVLIFALQAALRVFNLFLKSVNGHRHQSGQWVSPLRIPVFRFAGSSALIFVALPLILATAFGRFNTPFETYVLYAGGAYALASVPALASLICGCFVIWKQLIRPGDWIQVGSVDGEVAMVQLTEIRLVPVGGGEITIPMLYLLWNPLRRSPRPPDQAIDLQIGRKLPLDETLKALTELFDKSLNVELQTIGVNDRSFIIRAISHNPQKNTRTTMVETVTRALEQGVFEACRVDSVGEPH